MKAANCKLTLGTPAHTWLVASSPMDNPTKQETTAFVRTARWWADTLSRHPNSFWPKLKPVSHKPVSLSLLHVVCARSVPLIPQAAVLGFLEGRFTTHVQLFHCIVSSSPEPETFPSSATTTHHCLLLGSFSFLVRQGLLQLRVALDLICS